MTSKKIKDALLGDKKQYETLRAKMIKEGGYKKFRQQQKKAFEMITREERIESRTVAKFPK